MRRPKPVDDALLAVSLMTVVPTQSGLPESGRTGMSGWFPAVGLALGASVVGAIKLLPNSLTAKHPLLLAAVAIAYLAAVTRFLHWDGLADVADAWWGGATAQRRLEIMKDSSTGAFGVTALVLAFGLQLTAIAELVGPQVLFPLLAAPALARLSATFAAWLGSPAREDGLGRTVMGKPGVASLLAVAAVLGGVGWLAWTVYGRLGIAFVVFGIVLALVVPHLVAERMGGVTGDVMGASVLVVETALYVAAAFALGGVGV